MTGWAAESVWMAAWEGADRTSSSESLCRSDWSFAVVRSISSW